MIICPKCQRENMDGSRFCSRCGTALPELIEAYPEKQARKKPLFWIHPKFLAILIIVIVVCILLLWPKGGNKVLLTCHGGIGSMQYTYEVLGSKDKIKQVNIHLEEIDEDEILQEDDITYMEMFLEEERKQVMGHPGVNMEYSVEMKDDKLCIIVDAKLNLEKIPETFTGGTFIPYNNEWQTMDIERFKEYMQYWEGIGCE